MINILKSYKQENLRHVDSMAACGKFSILYQSTDPKQHMGSCKHRQAKNSAVLIRTGIRNPSRNSSPAHVGNFSLPRTPQSIFTNRSKIKLHKLYHHLKTNLWTQLRKWVKQQYHQDHTVLVFFPKTRRSYPESHSLKKSNYCWQKMWFKWGEKQTKKTPGPTT